MQEETLTNLGLSPEEASVYLSLIENGSQSAINLGKTTKVKRTYVYKVIQGLIAKGLASQGKQGRTTVFSALSPDHLLSLAEEKKQKVVASERMLESILPNLKGKFQTVDKRPTVQVFEGYSGLKKIYKDTIASGASIYAFLQNHNINPEFRSWLREEYLPQRISNKIHAKVIVASGEKSQMYMDESKTNLRESKVVPSEKYPFEVEVDIYGNKVAFINYKDEANPIGIILENEPIANSMRAYFELVWTNIK